jgi:hypothetical protein
VGRDGGARDLLTHDLVNAVAVASNFAQLASVTLDEMAEDGTEDARLTEARSDVAEVRKALDDVLKLIVEAQG